ncbi:MAG: CPBP family intramembrane metalloprotease [Alistipes senegalensis]|nr:CPBP family intramembrane metalloprotease [Bacteroides cellulosilyticus]MCM1351221.1 CPBP family intramembrane metalloprotease [Alistipes senegalensis]
MEENNFSGPVPVRRAFPTVGDLCAMLGILLGMQVLVAFVVSLVGGFVQGGGAEMTPDAQGRYLCLVYLTAMSLGLVGIVLYRRKRGGTERVVSFSTARLNPALLLWACVLLFAVDVVAEPLLALLPDTQPEVGRGIWTVVMLVGFAPLFEEVVCRGVVLGSLRAKYGVWVAWIGSSLFFAVLHVVPVMVVNALLIGLILGWLCLATGSLWASMLLHAINNAAAYLLLITVGDDVRLAELVGNRTLYAVLYAVALVVAVFSAYKIHGTLRQLKEAEKNRDAEPTAQ